MDIHAPETPIQSFKEFIKHIAIVTVGILIALGLEGIRESLHNRHLVQETRESFRKEMQDSLRDMNQELPRVIKGSKQLQALNAALPGLAEQHPDQVVAQLKAIKNPNYFYSTNSWQAALSTGALGHMSPDEVSMYAWSAEGTRIYTALQGETRHSEARARAFWFSHPHPNADQITEGMRLLQEFASDQDAMAFVAPQTRTGFENTLRTAETN